MTPKKVSLVFRSENPNYGVLGHALIKYKDKILPHSYDADFIVFNKIPLEVKAIEQLVPGNVRQTLNYLAASKMKLGLLVNFGEDSLKYKRILL